MDQTDLQQIRSTAPPEVLAVVLPHLEKLLKNSVDTAYQGERVLQLYRLQQSDAFYRGIQNVTPYLDTANGNASIAWSSQGQGTSQKDGTGRMFDYNPRLTKSYGDKYVAVLGARPFYSVGAEPGDPTSEDDCRGARQVNLLIEKLHGQWNIKVQNFSLFYNLFKNGTTLGAVRPVTDGRRFGYYEVPDIQMQPQQVGVDEYGQPVFDVLPVQVGTKKYPRSSVEMDLVNGYVATWPFNTVAKETMPWLVLEAQRDRGQLMQEYPNARGIVGSKVGSIISGDQSSATAAIARAAAQSQTGTVRSNYTSLWNWRQPWLPVSQLHVIEDDAARKAALQAFPEGCRITQIEGKVVAVEAVDLKQRISTCRPAMADYLFCEGASWGMFNLEDLYANLFEIAAETLETGVAQYISNPDYVDTDALNRSRYSPNRVIEALPRAGENIGNAIQALPTSRFPDQLPGMFDIIKSLMESYYGLFPQVYGQMPNNLTLGQARMMLNQGLMQLGTPGELATRFWEETMTNAVNLYVDTVHVNPDHKGQEIDLELIRRCSWNIKGPNSIPATQSERRENLMDIITQNPALTEMLQLLDPVNATRVIEIFSLPELENTTLDQIQALSDIIDQLWSQQPIQGAPQPGPDGQMVPGPIQPSIEFDPVVYDPKITAALCRQSLVKEKGQQRLGSPGYANVRAFLEAANNAMPPEPAEPMKVQASVNLNDLPQNQMEAVLGNQGIQVPPPQAPPINAQSKMAENEQEHQFDMENAQQQAILRPPPPENSGLGAIQ